jgi:hypothetical protein
MPPASVAAARVAIPSFLKDECMIAPLLVSLVSLSSSRFVAHEVKPLKPPNVPLNR